MSFNWSAAAETANAAIKAAQRLFASAPSLMVDEKITSLELERKDAALRVRRAIYQQDQEAFELAVAEHAKLASAIKPIVDVMLVRWEIGNKIGRKYDATRAAEKAKHPELIGYAMDDHMDEIEKEWIPVEHHAWWDELTRKRRAGISRY
jgi:hypothetical protein